MVCLGGDLGETVDIMFLRRALPKENLEELRDIATGIAIGILDSRFNKVEPECRVLGDYTLREVSLMFKEAMEYYNLNQPQTLLNLQNIKS